MEITSSPSKDFTLILKEALLPLAVSVFVAAYLFDTWGMPVQSRVFPYFAFIMLAGLTPALIVKEIYLQREEQAHQPEGWRVFRSPAIVLLAAAGYAVLIHFTHFAVASVIYIAGTILVLGGNWRQAVLVGIGFSLITYYVFTELFRTGI